MKTTSVGLLVFTSINGTLHGILQARGAWNFETQRSESWPGAHQITVHGKLHDGENPQEALKREIIEEIGIDYSYLLPVIALSSSKKTRVVSFIKSVPFFTVRQFRPHPGTGGLRLIREDEISDIKDVRKFSKAEGVNDRRVIAMFPDEIQTIKDGFAHLKG